MNELVDEASEESFPASDPPAWTSGTSVGVREHKERAPGVSVEEAEDKSNVGASRAAGEAQTARPVPSSGARKHRGKAKQRADRGAARPKTDDEDTLDMSRDRSRGDQKGSEQRSASAIPQPRVDDRNERHEAVQVTERKQERAHLAPEHTDDRTDLPGRRSASEGPHEVFPGEPRVTPPKPVLH